MSSVVGLLPFGGLDQLCIAQAESVFQPSVCLLCQEWSFFIAFSNLGRRNNAIYRQKTDQQQHPARVASVDRTANMVFFEGDESCLLSRTRKKEFLERLKNR